MSGRGRGGKFNKAKRGGGKHFSRDLQPLDKDGNPVGMWRDPADKEESEDESSEEESSEESSGGEGPATAPADGGELNREQRKEQARKKKLAAIARKNQKTAEVGDLPTDSEEEEDSDEDMPANPNHTQKARNQARAVSGSNTVPAEETKDPKKPVENMSRREREAWEAQKSRERFEKLRAEGKTDEARADLARLKLIREQRDQAAARKKAEVEEKESQQAASKERLDREAKKRQDALGAGAKKAAKGKK